MKLNLAALPKEEAWRIWDAASTHSTIAFEMWQLAGKPMPHGHNDLDVAYTVAQTSLAVLGSPRDNSSRYLFERWWAEQVQG